MEIDSRWAGACLRIAHGEPPFPKPRPERPERAPGEERSAAPPPAGSRPWALSLLGVTPDAGPEEIKRAFRALALRTHPDRGGEEAAFIDAKRAFDVALSGPKKRAKRRA